MALVKSCFFPPCVGLTLEPSHGILSLHWAATPGRSESRSKYLWPSTKSFRPPRPERKTLRVRGRGLAPHTRAERTLQPAYTESGNVGFEQFKPDWTWSKCKVQSVQRWEQKEREVNSLDPVVCGAAIDEWRRSAAGQWQAGFLRSRWRSETL